MSHEETPPEGWSWESLPRDGYCCGIIQKGDITLEDVGDGEIEVALTVEESTWSGTSTRQDCYCIDAAALAFILRRMGWTCIPPRSAGAVVEDHGELRHSNDDLAWREEGTDSWHAVLGRKLEDGTVPFIGIAQTIEAAILLLEGSGYDPTSARHSLEGK